MRFELRYTTHFDYPGPVVESHNELRACPTTNDRQRLVHYRATTNPQARLVSYRDYWGTHVDAFGIRDPHDELQVTAEATVETTPSPLPARSARMSALSDAAYRDTHAEYLQPTRHTAWEDAASEEASKRAEMFGPDVMSVVLGLHRSVGASFEYTPGATYIGVEVGELMARRRGVCQDFAHVVVAMCRSLGVAARYVSGYYFAHNDDDGNALAEEIHVETHAWLEVAIPGEGWWGLDPTNQQEVGEHHIKIGHGRDYDDVAPFRGTYTGPEGHELQAGVDIRCAPAQTQQQQ